MASSNRHWPSLFKSKPCNPHHQWQHDLNPSLLSGYHHRSNPYTSGIEEKGPEPKPRWNPKPEQIRILEAIFNSGMVNPPRDEIRKIRAQLQEYGQVGDANVFYWFQNRKSRTKHKNRQLAKNQQHNNKSTQSTIFSTNLTNNSTIPSKMITHPSSSSSSSDKSSPKLIFNKTNNNNVNPNDFLMGCASSANNNFLNQPSYSSPTASVNQTTYDHHGSVLVQHDPFMIPIQQLNYPIQQGFPDHHHNFSHSHQPQQMMNIMMPNNSNMNSNVMDAQRGGVGSCSEFLFSELMRNERGSESDQYVKKTGAEDHEETSLMMMKLGYPSAASSPISTSTALPHSSTLDQLQDHSSCVSAMVGPVKSTVFINDVAFDVHCGPFNVRDAFGNDAVLLHSTGQPVLTNEWGVTHEPLQHGAFYYLI